MRCIAEYDLFSEANLAKDERTIRVNHADGLCVYTLRRLDVPAPDNRCSLRMWIEFDVDEIRVSYEAADRYAAQLMNAMALVTGCSVEVSKIRRIIEWRNENAERQALIFTHDAATDAPFDVLDARLAQSIGFVLAGEKEAVLSRAMRWFRQALAQKNNSDRFQCFWLCVEVLVPLFKTQERVHDSCAKCKGPLFCEKCGEHPTHRPYPKQTIERLISECANGDSSVFERLNKVRNGIAHGEALSVILPDQDELVATMEMMGQAAFLLIMRAMGKVAGAHDKLDIGVPTSYSNMTMRAMAHVSSVFREDEEGMPIDGPDIKFEVVRTLPPEPIPRAQVRLYPDEPSPQTVTGEPVTPR